MTNTKVFRDAGALTITAFPLSDVAGFVIRAGETDHDGPFLGTVFHEADVWSAYAALATGAEPFRIGTDADLDALIRRAFLEQVRFSLPTDGPIG
ncbi:hypothetical protein ACGGZK_07815 [Agromyces sp. MMS24-K17]|uniref:hypothetical protein n=1 Tax=Agromyces sp. MMS24-K17 TaxID=3372850 RepID=UPI003754165D